MRRFVVLAVLAATLAACGSATAGRTSSSSSPQEVKDLSVTSTVRAELLKAGAALDGLPASAFKGLVADETYYAYDPATTTYWAGAALVPSSKSLRAQISVQDDGSYLLFNRRAGKPWRADDVGLTGIAGTKCPVRLPAPVLAVWNWAPGTCRPRNS